MFDSFYTSVRSNSPKEGSHGKAPQWIYSLNRSGFESKLLYI
jgi:hypothetical protein